MWLPKVWSVVCGVVAVGLIVIVLQDAFEVMLLPRRVQRRARFVAVYFRSAWRGFASVARRLPPQRREGVASYFGALAMLGLFAAWATAAIVSFGVLEWSLSPGPGARNAASLSATIYLSGVTFFTLGYGDVVPHTGAGRLVAVIEAGVGLGFIAGVIGYLPLIHQLYSRREAMVIQLDVRAGSPPSACAMLCLHADVLDELDDFLRRWEIWAAELLEGHLTYPMLGYYRSQHDNQSWVGALAAVTDACALILTGLQGVRTFQARMTFGTLRQVLTEMNGSFSIAPSAYDGGDRLAPDGFALVEAALAEAGLHWREPETAGASLTALRATYEPALDGLARHLMLRLPEWLPSDEPEDHWRRGHRGGLATRMVEELSKGDDAT